MTNFPFTFQDLKDLEEEPAQPMQLVSYEENSEWAFALAVRHNGEDLLVELPDCLSQVIAKALVEHHETVREMTFFEGQLSSLYFREEVGMLSAVGKVIHTLRGRGLYFYFTNDGVQDSLWRKVPVGFITNLPSAL